MLTSLTAAQRDALAHWLPALTAGLAAGLLFISVGHTPLTRAAGLALAVVGVGLMLRRWGALLALVGALAFTLSPAFWSQTGGRESFGVDVIVIGLVVAVVGWLAAARLTGRHGLAVIIGMAVFAVLFVTGIGGPRSLRLTTVLAAWVLYLLVDALALTNPRPDEHAPAQLRLRHTLGIVLLLIAGVANDPLFTLLIPAVMLGLFLSRARLPLWYWGALGLLLLAGLYGIYTLYVREAWWGFSSLNARDLPYDIPYIIWGGLRDPLRWLDLFRLIIEQFTPFGLVLGIIGLARLSRWYPPLGVVTLIAYGTYFFFGLVYFGRNATVLLLPLLMIQTCWMTYAVYAFGQWLQRSLAPQQVRWLAAAAFTLLPLFLLLKIVGAF